ncbi:DUF6284 family protein [Promicromonospora sukumoe]
MSTNTALAAFGDEPTPAELAAIDAEAPVIAAELDVVTAECRLALSPDELAIKAHRRAVTRLNVVLRTNRTTTAPVYAPSAALSTARRVVIRPATRTA